MRVLSQSLSVAIACNLVITFDSHLKTALIYLSHVKPGLTPIHIDKVNIPGLNGLIRERDRRICL